MRHRRAAALLLAPALLLAGCGHGDGKRRTASAGPALAPTGSLNAGGEPQWSAQIRAGRLSFISGGDPALSAKVDFVEHGKSTAVWSGPLAAADGKPEAGAPTRVLRLTATAKPCEDGPTGMRYPLTATVEAAGHRYDGCAAAPGQGLGPRT